MSTLALLRTPHLLDRLAGCSRRSHADLTEALGLELTGEGKAYPKGDGPNKALGFHTKRCKRSAMFVVDGVIKVMQAPVPDEPSMRKLVVVAPTQDAIDKLRTMLKEALGREDSKRLRAEGEAPPKAEPKRLTASSLTFVPFERGSEQAQDAPVRSAPGDAMKRDRRGRRVITVGEGEGAQELAVFFTEVRRARNPCHVIASPCSKRASPCALPLPYE